MTPEVTANGEPAGPASHLTKGPLLASEQGTALRRWVDWLDGHMDSASDWLNPIVVKETRQALKSRQFTLWFLMLLVGCWFVTIGGIAMLGPGVSYGAYGDDLFSAYYCVLLFPLIVVVPFSALRSVASEQDDNTRDLLTVSSLTPSQIVQGKLASSMVQVGVYFSALAPCLAFTYLLRGVDVPTIVGLLAMAVLVSLGLSIFGIFLASAFRQRFSNILISLVFIGVLFYAFAGVSVAGVALLQSGSFFGGAPIALLMAIWGSFYATTFAIVYYAAVAASSFSSANRSTPLRIAATVQHAVTLGWVLCGVWGDNGDTDLIEMIGLFLCGYWTLAGALMVSEQPLYSDRVRRTLPSSWGAQAFFSWFLPGPGTGYFLVLSNLLGLVLFSYCCELNKSVSIGSTDWRPFCMMVLACCYVASYLGVARLAIGAIRSVAPISAAGCILIQVLLCLVGSAVPFLIQVSTRELRNLPYSWVEVTNPFWTLNGLAEGSLPEGDLTMLLVVIPAAAACIILLNIPVTLRELQQPRAQVPARVLAEIDQSQRPGAGPTSPWDVEEIGPGAAASQSTAG